MEHGRAELVEPTIITGYARTNTGRKGLRRERIVNEKGLSGKALSNPYKTAISGIQTFTFENSQGQSKTVTVSYKYVNVVNVKEN